MKMRHWLFLMIVLALLVVVGCSTPHHHWHHWRRW
jgi:uncharacterized protein YcfL